MSEPIPVSMQCSHNRFHFFFSLQFEYTATHVLKLKPVMNVVVTLCSSVYAENDPLLKCS